MLVEVAVNASTKEGKETWVKVPGHPKEQKGKILSFPAQGIHFLSAI
jgi:hypothetical protein